MLADQTKVSPWTWFRSDPSVGFSCLSAGWGSGALQRVSLLSPPAAGESRGDTGTRSVTRRQRNSAKSSVTSQDTGNLCWSGGAAAVISAQTSPVHSLDILRAKLTLLQCGVSARSRLEVERAENARALWVKASRQRRRVQRLHANAHMRARMCDDPLHLCAYKVTNTQRKRCLITAL